MSQAALLLFASVALVLGPLLSVLGARSRAIRGLIDGFALVVVSGICLVVVVPHVVVELGIVGLGLVFLGVCFQFLATR